MDSINILLDSPLQLQFPLEKYGYMLERVLNNENRWDVKIVCSILDRDFKRYVSTTYAEQNDYLNLLECTTYLKCNCKLSPQIARLYPKDKTIVCDYIGEFLSDYLLNKHSDIFLSLLSVFSYLKDVNSINQTYRTFITPSIIKESLRLSKELADDFEFLPNCKTILLRLEDADIKFPYGYGIEDPHIWNFRIVKTATEIEALTTDFDYFSDRVNYFWELGYFYATFRWFKKTSFSLACKAEKFLLSLIQSQDLKAEFMFWLGVLSSYCGYRDSLRSLMANGGMARERLQYRLIQQLEERVSHLANKVLAKKNS